MKLLTTAVLATSTLFAGVAVQAQTPCVTPVKHKHKHVEPCATAEKQLSDLEAQLKAQQAQIDALSQQLANQKPTPETDPIATPIANKAEADAVDAQSQAASATSTANSAKATAVSAAADAAVAKKEADELESPAAIHYKNVFITPGGFAAAESVYRTRALNSDIATPFNSIQYGNGGNIHISEFNGSVRQSRLALGVMAPFDWGKAGAYFETDFLGAGVTSNNNQTNSYVLRVRSAFGYVTLNNGFTFQGGQMFTLATEDKKGVLAGAGAEALPPTIDPNYIVGFNFGRQYAIRLAQSFAGGKASAAVAIEGSQIILASTSNAPDNFVYGGAGSTGGLFNNGGFSGAQNYTDNLAPDLLAKVAFDPSFGHFEVGGIARFFRDRIYPQATFSTTVAGSTTGAYNNVTLGGGFFASARVHATKYADVALKVAAGDGTGRYGASNLGDVTVKPSGALEPLHDGQSLAELDLHPTKKLDIFALAGVEYLQRTSYFSGVTGIYTGYAPVQGQNDTGCNTQAAPVAGTTSGVVPANGANCAGLTRVIEEGNVGLTYRFFSSPTKGRFQMQVIYEYLTREGWNGYKTGSYAAATGFAAGTTFGSPKATENMVHTSFRYYIP